MALATKWDLFRFKMLTGWSCPGNLLPRDRDFDKSFKLSKLGHGKVRQLGSYIKEVHFPATGRGGFIYTFVKPRVRRWWEGASGWLTGNWAISEEHTRTHICCKSDLQIVVFRGKEVVSAGKEVERWVKAEQNNQPRTRVNCFQIICGIKEAGGVTMRVRLFSACVLFSQPGC